MADIYNIATQAYQQGRQRAQDKRLNELAQLAMRNPSALPELGAQMAGIDASAGLQLSGAIQERQLADAERNRNRATGFARYLQRIKDPAQRAQIAQLYGKKVDGLPQDLSDEGIGAFIASAGGQQTNNNLTPSLQSLIWQRDNGILTPEQFNTAVMVQNRLEAGAAAPGYKAEDRWNPVTKQMETVFVQTTGYIPGVGGPVPGIPQQMPTTALNQPSQNVDAQMQEIGRRAQEMERSGVRPDIVQGFINGEMDRLGLSRAQGQSFDIPGSAPTLQPMMQPPAALGAAFPAGPSYDEEAEQVRREAIAREQGATEGQGPRKPEEDLRKEYMAAVATARDTLAQFKKVEQAAQTPSAAGDLALIFSFMKMLDPGSVVREQEFANAQNAAGVPDQIINLYNRVLSGQRLNPNQRQDFLGQARNLAAEAQRSFDENRQFYTDLARQYNLNPGRVVRGAGDISGGGEVQGRQVRRTGTLNGRRVVEYTDGSVEYGD